MGATARVCGTVLISALASAALVRVLGGGLPELVFGMFMIGGLLVVLQLAADGWRSSRREASRARELAGTSPDLLARRAVAEERRRLEADLEATIRDALAGIVDLARDAEEPESMRRIQRAARAATSELRRQLGLLRTTPPDQAPAPESPPDRSRTRPTRGEASFAAAVALLGIAEVAAFAALEDYPTDSIPATAAFTGAAAATAAWRRVAPVAATLACAGIFAGGSLAGTPVTEGLWFAAAVGTLLWTVAARGRLLGTGGLAVLAVVVATLVTRWLHAPENLGVCVAVELVALVGGLTVRALARRQARAESSAGLREAELQEAVDLAVSAERTAVARELHDVVSHAVGLVAVQAAAAEVSWHTDEEASRRALELVRTTAEETLGEVDRLLPGGATSAKGVSDLEALVARIGAAGTPVDLRVAGEPGAADLRVAYRVVQEALTNVVRHAPGAAARVRVDVDSAGTEVTVSDDGPGAVGAVSRGYGLIGLTERVELAGGSLSTGPGPNGRGFRVAATLPAPVRAADELPRTQAPRSEAAAP
jgi:signal transduction histidine kinase